MDLKKLIKEATQDLKLKKSCSCGCNTCDDTRSLAPILNESIAPREILSEGLKHHITQNKPLTENVYRAGSENYFNLWAEARSLYSRRILEIQNEDDLEILTETNLGEFGILEDGTKVPLDFPIEEKNLTESTNYFIPKITKDKKHPNFLYINIPYPTGKGFLDALGTQTAAGQERQQGAKKALSIGQKIYDKIENHPDIEDIDITDLENGIVQIFIVSDTLTPEKLSDLTESKNENKPIGKPMRDSSGGKAYKVYVKDPKTKKIKTVRFGSGGLKAKINDPKARQAFAKRHDCKNKKDRTKPSYWSCRLPRYASLLGLKSSFSGFW
jgi:hypothetical protein